MQTVTKKNKLWKLGEDGLFAFVFYKEILFNRVFCAFELVQYEWDSISAVISV